MSKTQLKLAAGLEQVLKVVPAAVQSFLIDVGQFRTMFKLTSLGKKQVARAIGDVLTTDGITGQFGLWLIAEVDNPVFQMCRFDKTHQLEFDTGPKDGPVDLYIRSAPKRVARKAKKAAPSAPAGDFDPEAWVKQANIAQVFLDAFTATELYTLSINAFSLSPDDDQPHTTKFLRKELKKLIKKEKDTKKDGCGKYEPITKESEVDALLTQYQEHLTNGDRLDAEKIGLRLNANGILFTQDGEGGYDWYTKRADLVQDGDNDRTLDIDEVDPERAAWEADEAAFGPELKLEFTPAEREELWSKGLIGKDALDHSFPYLRTRLSDSPQKVAKAEAAYYGSIEHLFTPAEWRRLNEDGLVNENADSPPLTVAQLREALVPKEPKKVKGPVKAKKPGIVVSWSPKWEADLKAAFSTSEIATLQQTGLITNRNESVNGRTIRQLKAELKKRDKKAAK